MLLHVAMECTYSAAIQVPEIYSLERGQPVEGEWVAASHSMLLHVASEGYGSSTKDV
jgi:hypothetical protein